MDYSQMIAPRVSQTEDAFRVYEPFIVRALEEGEFVVNPLEAARGRSIGAKTFCYRFMEAKGAFEKFGYKSQMIRRNYPMKELSAMMMKDGNVLVRNKLILRNGWTRSQAAEFAVEGKMQESSGMLRWTADESILLLDREKLDREGKSIYDWFVADKAREEEKKRVKGEGA